MQFTLSNDQLTITVNSKGAELTSIKGPNGIEYLWQADPNFWGRHAPILFPIVGRLKNDRYEYEGQSYSMGQHGFARDMEFALSDQTDTSLTMVLTANTETKAMYPFDFMLFVQYTLVHQTVQVVLTVVNPATKALYFSVGAHPAFNVPLTPTAHFDDYQFKIAPAVDLDQVPLEHSLSATRDAHHLALDQPLPVNHQSFENDAIILAVNRQPIDVTLAARSAAQPRVSLHAVDAQYLGLWSQFPKAADFVCIEPWWGIADDVNADGSLVDKKGIHQLAAGGRFDAQFTITVN